MSRPDSTVTIHMAASLDGFIARSDGGVDWMETADAYESGETLDPDDVRAFLQSIDCYVMGSRTYETALDFEAKGAGWAYGATPVFVLTTRSLPKRGESVRFLSGDVGRLLEDQLKPQFRNIWVAGGGAVAGEVLRRGLADEVRYSILPVAIGRGVRFFDGLDRDVALHLVEVKTYTTGVVAARYTVPRA